MAHALSHPIRLVAGSACRQAQVGVWIEARDLIGRPSTFELDDVVRLDSGPCDRCDTELLLRWQSESTELAA